jgi:hypothetical protein
MGCFLMLMLGTIMVIGLARLAAPTRFMELARGSPGGWRRAVLLWIVTPTIAIALVAWFTYGFKGISAVRKRRPDVRG